MNKDKRFIVWSRKEKKKKMKSFDTYEDACNYIETLKNDMVYCSIEDKDLKL